MQLFVVLAMLTLGLTFAADAQTPRPMAVTAESWNAARTLRLQLHGQPVPVAAIGDSRKGHHFWLWVAGGAVVGAATGLIWAGRQIVKSDDPMMVEPALALVGGVGAVAGGALGAVAWVVAHPAPDE